MRARAAAQAEEDIELARIHRREHRDRLAAEHQVAQGRLVRAAIAQLRRGLSGQLEGAAVARLHPLVPDALRQDIAVIPDILQQLRRAERLHPVSRQVRERGEREAAEEQRITRLFQLPAAGPGKERLQKLGLLVLPQRLRGQAAREQIRVADLPPGILRGSQRQTLLETNIGKSCWDEWRDWLEAETDELPETESLADDWDDLPPLADALITGVLRKGHKMLLAGPSKAGKSFALIELCIAIAEGTPWLGRFSCAQGKVLYINLELDRASCLHRFKDVYTALGLPPQNLRNIDIWNLRGASVPMDKLAPKLIRRAGKKGYTAVILDPIYKVITGDENSADQMAKFCNQFDLVCRALDCAVIYCHHHSKGAQGGKRSMDRASGSGVFARDPDAMLDMTELTPTDAILEQLHNKAACRVLKAMLDKRGHADAYGPDDALSKSRMLAIAKEHLGMADLRAIDAQIATAQKRADSMTAWRIEGTLREFARFDPVNLWFDYPVHKPDTGLLEDLQPDSDYKSLGTRGASKRWGNKDKVSKDKKAELDTAFEACMMDGKVTVYSMAEYMGLKPDTVRRRLKADGGFWIDGADIGRKEPGSAG